MAEGSRSPDFARPALFGLMSRSKAEILKLNPQSVMRLPCFFDGVNPMCL